MLAAGQEVQLVDEEAVPRRGGHVQGELQDRERGHDGGAAERRMRADVGLGGRAFRDLDDWRHRDLLGDDGGYVSAGPTGLAM